MPSGIRKKRLYAVENTRGNSVRYFSERERRIKICRKIAHQGGSVEDCLVQLGNVQREALRSWLGIHDPMTLQMLGVKKQGGPTISAARAKARIAVCERIASEGGTLRDAAGALDTITPNGLYSWLRTFAPETFRRICGRKGDKGSNLQLRGPRAAYRIKLIQELGYTLAARRLGMHPTAGRNALYHWLRYRKKIGVTPEHVGPPQHLRRK